MKKADYIEKLTEAGKTEEELNGLTVKQLEVLYKELETDTPKPDINVALRIISKRRDGSNEYWLEDGTVLPWSELAKYCRKSGVAPEYKAKDYARLTKDGWELLSREEYEKEEAQIDLNTLHNGGLIKYTTGL